MSSSLCPPRYNESDPDFVALWGDKKRHMEAPGRVCTQYIPGYLPSSALFLLLWGLLRGGEEGRVVRNPLLQSDSVPALHPSLCYAASSLYSGKPRSRLKGGVLDMFSRVENKTSSLGYWVLISGVLSFHFHLGWFQSTWEILVISSRTTNESCRRHPRLTLLWMQRLQMQL